MPFDTCGYRELKLSAFGQCCFNKALFIIGHVARCYTKNSCSAASTTTNVIKTSLCIATRINRTGQCVGAILYLRDFIGLRWPNFSRSNTHIYIQVLCRSSNVYIHVFIFYILYKFNCAYKIVYLVRKIYQIKVQFTAKKHFISFSLRTQKVLVDLQNRIIEKFNSCISVFYYYLVLKKVKL